MRFRGIRLRRPKKESAAKKAQKKAERRQRHQCLVQAAEDGPSFHLHLPSLSANEEYFFSIVKAGDIDVVHDFLYLRPMFNINCRDYHGYTALIEATIDENVEMVQHLLTLPGIKPFDALLHAVNTRHDGIITMIIDWEQSDDDVKTIDHGICDAANFDSDITPLMLACHNDDYHIINLLLGRGHRLRDMHTADCFCQQECSHRLDGEDLCDSKARLNMFMALVSRNYISLTAPDPILTIFYLSHNARKFAEYEPQYMKEYTRLSVDMALFAAHLIGLCRTSKEVELVLTAPYGNERRVHDNPFPRLLLALELEQKPFVAHGHTQYLVHIAWLGEWSSWQMMGLVRKTLHVASRFLFLPLMAFVYLILPSFSCIDNWRAPINKYITFLCSYFIFLGLLFYQTNLVAENITRGPPQSGIEWVLVIYVIAFGSISVKTLMQEKWKFFKQIWNIYDLVTLSLFVVTFLSWLLAYLDVSREGQLMLERPRWHKYDWTLFGEAFYSMAVIASLLKLLFYLQLSQILGPLQLMLGSMIADTLRFLTIWFVVMLSFAVGLYTLYHQYLGMVRERDGEIVKQGKGFATLPQTISSLYWAIYGYTIPELFIEVILPAYTTIINNETVTIYNEHDFTEAVGHTMFAIYHVCSIIVLVNVLIAMMSSTYSSIQDNADCEWKFCRTKMYSNYLSEGGIMPPPFNIIPSPKSFLIYLRLRIMGDPTAHFSFLKCFYVDTERKYTFDENLFVAFNDDLMQRYSTERRIALEKRTATVNDVTNLQHDVREVIKMKKLLLTREIMRTASSSDSALDRSFTRTA